MNVSSTERGGGPQRLRLTYARDESLRFISHQDEFRMWERTIRRTQMPLAYKHGFNPQPHMQFAAPLGVGFSGSRELMDFRLERPLPEAEVTERLTRALVPGVRIVHLQTVGLQATPLQATLLGADYTLRVQTAGLPDGPRRVREFLERTAIWRTRQRKGREYRYNLRPVVHELSYAGPTADGLHVALQLRVQMLEGATGRPDEVLAELGLTDFPHLLHRDRLYFASNAEDAAVFAPYTLARQSDIAWPEAVPPKRKARSRRRQHAQGKENRSDRPQDFGSKAADEFR